MSKPRAYHYYKGYEIRRRPSGEGWYVVELGPYRTFPLLQNARMAVDARLLALNADPSAIPVSRSRRRQAKAAPR